LLKDFFLFSMSWTLPWESWLILSFLRKSNFSILTSQLYLSTLRSLLNILLFKFWVIWLLNFLDKQWIVFCLRRIHLDLIKLWFFVDLSFTLLLTFANNLRLVTWSASCVQFKLTYSLLLLWIYHWLILVITNMSDIAAICRCINRRVVISILQYVWFINTLISIIISLFLRIWLSPLNQLRFLILSSNFNSFRF
jgi:hypothetical protein